MAAPEYKEDEPIVVLGASGSLAATAIWSLVREIGEPIVGALVQTSRPTQLTTTTAGRPVTVNWAVAGVEAEVGGVRPPAPSRESLRGLDWSIFFLADVQTGFGPFIAVYLTTQKWTQAEIGLVLTIGGLVGLIGQMPGGAIVDFARSERLVASLAVVTIGTSALAYAAWPILPIVLAAATLHAAASCVLGPAIAAISLGLVGPLGIGERFGRNARFAALGNGTAAAAMGTCGYLLSSRSVFLVTAALAIPTLLALARIREREIDAARAHGAVPRAAPDIKSNQRSRSGAPACPAGLRRQHIAASTRQRGDASFDGRGRNDAVEPVGTGIDRRLHYRAASHCGADVSVRWTQGPAMG